MMFWNCCRFTNGLKHKAKILGGCVGEGTQDSERIVALN